MVWKRLMVVLILVTAVFIAGVAGYMIIEGWGFLDALYMCVITLSSVGFKEVGQLSSLGQIFTIALIVGGMTVVTFSIALFTTIILGGDLGIYIRSRRMEKRIKALKEHVIICGLGELGIEVIKNLAAAGKQFVAIENSQQQIDNARTVFSDLIYVQGDARNQPVLEKANISEAKTLITCLGSDSLNLFVVITAKEANPSLTVVTEAVDSGVRAKLRKAGSDYIISPSQIGGSRMASVATMPAVVGFLDVITAGGDRDLQIESISVKPGSSLSDKTLVEARIPQQTGLIVISIKKKDEERYIYNPSSQTKLEPGDEIIVLGPKDNILQLREYITG